MGDIANCKLTICNLQFAIQSISEDEEPHVMPRTEEFPRAAEQLAKEPRVLSGGDYAQGDFHFLSAAYFKAASRIGM